MRCPILRGFSPVAAGGSAPATPTLSLVNDGDGDAITATVDGAAGVTNTLLYRAAGDTSWTVGSGRSGDGEINQSGLDDDTWYLFQCVSSSGAYNSRPSLPAFIYCTSGGAASAPADPALIADAEAMMTEWGESITYVPNGRDARIIMAIIERDVPRDVGGAGEPVIRPATTIEVLNRSTSTDDDDFGGIGSDQLDTGGDTVTVARRIGEAVREMRIAQLLEQDEAMLTLEVR